MIIQREIEKQVIIIGLNGEFYMPDVELKLWQRVSLWIKNFTLCQFLDQLFHNASGFDLNILQRVNFRIQFINERN